MLKLGLCMLALVLGVCVFIGSADAQALSINTDTSYTYTDTGLTVTGGTSWVFWVKACSDAHLALSKVQNNQNTDTYEVVIGGWGNSKSAIRRAKQGPNLAQTSQSGVISCTLYKELWVSWAGGVIALGSGGSVGNNVIVSYTDTFTPYDVNFLAVATGWGSTGDWIFHDPAFLLDDITVRNDVYGYADLGLSLLPLGALGLQYFTFSVQQCNDVHIALSKNQGVYSSDTYEVVIGGWSDSKSVIRSCTQCGSVSKVMTDNLLNCGDFNKFWVTWDGSTVRVGTGALMDNELMAFHNPNPYDISFLSFSAGFGSFGIYAIPSGPPPVIVPPPAINTHTDNTLHTDTSYTYVDVGADLQQSPCVLFEVKACNDAHIALATTQNDYDTATYEIVLGGWGNTQSVIRRAKQGSHMAEVDTPNVVDCTDYRQFYICMDGGTVRVGQGNRPNLDEIMAFDDPNPYTPRYVGVATGWGSDGDWKILAATAPRNCTCNVKGDPLTTTFDNAGTDVQLPISGSPYQTQCDLVNTMDGPQIPDVCQYKIAIVLQDPYALINAFVVTVDRNGLVDIIRHINHPIAGLVLVYIPNDPANPTTMAVNPGGDTSKSHIYSTVTGCEFSMETEFDGINTSASITFPHGTAYISDFNWGFCGTCDNNQSNDYKIRNGTYVGNLPNMFSLMSESYCYDGLA